MRQRVPAWRRGTLRVPGGTHHKDAAGRSARVALGLGGADGLEVVGLLAGVEGVVVEGGHQVGVHLAEELAHLDGDTETESAPSGDGGTAPLGLPRQGLAGVRNVTRGTRLESSAPCRHHAHQEERFGGCSAHLVPVILLVGEHQEASVVNEDTDEVLGKEDSVTYPPRPPGGEEGGQGPAGPPQTSAAPPALPTTHLVVGLAVHLAAARGVALSTEMAAHGGVRGAVLPCQGHPSPAGWGPAPRAG